MNLMTFKGKLVFVLGVVLITTFLIVGITFNTIINDSILNNARSAIEDSRNIITSSNRMNQRLFVSTQNFIMTPSYDVLHSQFMHSHQLMMFHRMMANTLKDNQIEPSNIIHELRINNDLYYLNVIENPNETNQWIVLYISMSTLANLRSNLNVVLFLILGFMLIISMLIIGFIASSMTLPLTQIAQFATSVGQGSRSLDEHKFHELELIQIQNAMNTMVLNLDEQEQANRHFFQNISHELRTPLQVILAQTEAFQYDFVSKEQTIDVLSHQGDRLKSLIDDLLVLSRLEGHIVDVVIESYDVRDVIEEVSSSMSVLLHERNLNMSYQFPNQLSQIKIDESSLHKVLINLLSNAIRYAHHNITWSVKEHPNEIEISISNDGDMIPDTIKNAIFDRFIKGEKGHIGIGLAIVKAVMDHYGGRVEVLSNQEKTTFILYFKK